MIITSTTPCPDYQLIDSGEGEKLERYGQYVLARPDPQALWPKMLPASEWQKANAFFERQDSKQDSKKDKNSNWITRNQMPEKWLINFAGLKFGIKLSSFKHTGLFPEQQPHWDWMREKITQAKREIKVLNLFGYTGGASLACAQVGADVCHLDGSKVAVSWARENAADSNLSDKKIRWIVDDARTFVNREVKRNSLYDAIVMDPPAFGHGPKRELWRIENDLLPLLQSCQKILSKNPLFFIINGYASGYSSLGYANNIAHIFKDQGRIEMGELSISHAKDSRLLPCGIFARWSSQ